MLFLAELASRKHKGSSSSASEGRRKRSSTPTSSKKPKRERAFFPSRLFLFTSRRTQGAVVDAVREAPRILLQVKGREKSAGKRGARGGKGWGKRGEFALCSLLALLLVFE